MFPHGVFEVVVSFLILRSAFAASTCYFPSGAIATGNVPCNNGTEFSSCCGSASACLANGLCRVNDDENTFEFARGGCTDPTWSSTNCFQHCFQSASGIRHTNGAAVFECDATGFQNPADYCCETGTNQKDSCCQTPALRFQLAAGAPAGSQVIVGASGQASSTPQSSTAIVIAPTTRTTLRNVATTIISVVTPILQRTTITQTPVTTTTKQDEQQSSTSSTTSISSSPSSTSTPPQSSSIDPVQTPVQTPGDDISSNSQNTGTQSSPAANSIAVVETGPSQTTKIAIGVAVPVAVLLVALLGFLFWNNHRNKKKIKALQSDLNNGQLPPPASNMISAPMAIVKPGDTRQGLVAEMGTEQSAAMFKPLPAYPQREYYKPNPYGDRSVQELNGDSRRYELPPTTAYKYELETPTTGYKSQRRY